MDKISVIMPAYNVAEHIDASIQSVLSQTYKNLELIIVNDGSTDETASRIQAWMAKELRIVYIKQDNKGVSEARNIGMAKATGKYIAFLDADDLWLPEAMEVLYNHIQAIPDARFVYGKTDEVFPDGHVAPVGPPAHDGYLEDFIHTNNELRLTYHISAVLIDRELLRANDIRFATGIRVSEDTGFFIEVMSVTAAYGIDSIISKYIRRDGSATGNKQWKPTDWDGQVKIYPRIEGFVKVHRPQAMVAFQRMRDFVAYRYVLKCLRHGHIAEGRNYITEWQPYLREFVNSNGRLNDKLKCRLILYAVSSPKILQQLGKI